MFVCLHKIVFAHDGRGFETLHTVAEVMKIISSVSLVVFLLNLDSINASFPPLGHVHPFHTDHCQGMANVQIGNLLQDNVAHHLGGLHFPQDSAFHLDQGLVECYRRSGRVPHHSWMGFVALSNDLDVLVLVRAENHHDTGARPKEAQVLSAFWCRHVGLVRPLALGHDCCPANQLDVAVQDHNW